MAEFNNLSKLSPVPIVDLREPSLPSSGFSLELSDSCKANYIKGDKCREHYRDLTKSAALKPGEFVLCPFGFSSFPFRSGETLRALTGFVPFPRMGGKQEPIIAKRHKELRITRESVVRIATGLVQIDEDIRRLEDQTVKKHSLAFHEIRKLNRQVNQTAERLCREDSPQDPDSAEPKLVTIWKTADLMSKQFEVMELLANESLAELPRKSVSEPYRMFDKCIRVYRVPATKDRFRMSSPIGYMPKVIACDKTFPIIPTVLIQNAIKYSMAASEIRVHIESSGAFCKVTVTSVSSGQELLDDGIFERGVRGSSELEGSGNGLYLAQLVAKQHGTRISVSSVAINHLTMLHSFTVLFETV